MMRPLINMIEMPVPSWDSRIPFAVVLAWDSSSIMLGFRKRSTAWVWRHHTRSFRDLPRLSIGLECIFSFSNRGPQSPLRRHIHLEI